MKIHETQKDLRWTWNPLLACSVAVAVEFVSKRSTDVTGVALDSHSQLRAYSQAESFRYEAKHTEFSFCEGTRGLKIDFTCSSFRDSVKVIRS